jgi:hypothetical protein
MKDNTNSFSLELTAAIDKITINYDEHGQTIVRGVVTISGAEKLAIENFSFVSSKKIPIKKVLTNLQTNASQVLATACKASVFESVSLEVNHNKHVGKNSIRARILKTYKEDFDRRNETPNNSKDPKDKMTLEKLVEDVIEAWKRLEKEQGKMIERPKAHQIADVLEMTDAALRKQIRKYRVFDKEDMPEKESDDGSVFHFDYDNIKPSYDTFINYCRLIKEQRGVRIIVVEKPA